MKKITKSFTILFFHLFAPAKLIRPIGKSKSRTILFFHSFPPAKLIQPIGILWHIGQRARIICQFARFFVWRRHGDVYYKRVSIFSSRARKKQRIYFQITRRMWFGQNHICKTKTKKIESRLTNTHKKKLHIFTWRMYAV